MTYNQLTKELQTILESHAMITVVKNETPSDWINRGAVPDFPVCCFYINTGTFNLGREQMYSVQFFFLDKSGADNEFERDVINDQVHIAEDIVRLMRGTRREFSISDSVNFTTLSDKFEDYLAGVQMTIEITTQSGFDGCDVPLK